MASEHTVDTTVIGSELEIRVGTVVKKVNVEEINKSYLAREFARGLKLRIDNAAAGVDVDAKLAAKLKMLEAIDFKDPSGGIHGGSRKESAEAFLARILPGLKTLEDYNDAVTACQASVKKADQTDALVELSTKLPELLSKK